MYRQSRACLIYTLTSQVQGVFFRKYTVAEAQRLGLVGYVRNTERGTVEGEAQGPPNELAAFKVQCTIMQSGQCNTLAQGAHLWLFAGLPDEARVTSVTHRPLQLYQRV